MTHPLPIEVVIFGGGAAGLWLLDELVRAGRSTLLLEAHELGSGQTIASQGIIQLLVAHDVAAIAPGDDRRAGGVAGLAGETFGGGAACGAGGVSGRGGAAG